MKGDATLRVAVVCPYDLSRPGGVQGQARGLSSALREAGHEVLLVAPDNRPAGWVPGPCYIVGRSTAVRANGSVAPVALNPRAAIGALRAVVSWQADVVHLHEPLAPVVGYGLLARRRPPVVATFHRAGAGVGYRWGAPLVRWATRRIDAAFAVSEAAGETAAVAGARCEVLFNGVDLERFVLDAPVTTDALVAPGGPVPAGPDAADGLPGSSRAGERPGAQGSPRASDPPAIVFLGRHEARKGLGVLLAAHARMTQPAILWICGDGPETGALRARYPESAFVRWLGVVGEAEVAARLARSCVLCAPSLGGESFGMVLVEAMASGCRVVASDIEGYRAAAGGHAVLVPPGDPAALGRALDTAVGAPFDADADARRAAAAHAARWSMAALAAHYVQAYRHVLAARGPRRPV